MCVNDTRGYHPSLEALPRNAPGNVLLVGALIGLALVVGLVVSSSEERSHAQGPEQVISGFGTPSSLAAGPRGTLYIADAEKGEVVCVYPDGEQVVLGSGLASPTALTVDPMGTVYVYSSTDKAIHAISPDGNSQVLVRDQPHILDLAATQYGSLLIAGSDGSVREFRLDHF